MGTSTHALGRLGAQHASRGHCLGRDYPGLLPLRTRIPRVSTGILAARWDRLPFPAAGGAELLGAARGVALVAAPLWKFPGAANARGFAWVADMLWFVLRISILLPLMLNFLFKVWQPRRCQD